MVVEADAGGLAVDDHAHRAKEHFIEDDLGDLVSVFRQISDAQQVVADIGEAVLVGRELLGVGGHRESVHQQLEYEDRLELVVLMDRFGLERVHVAVEAHLVEQVRLSELEGERRHRVRQKALLRRVACQGLSALDHAFFRNGRRIERNPQFKGAFVVFVELAEVEHVSRD